jgi:hypothetical protein
MVILLLISWAIKKGMSFMVMESVNRERQT